MTTRTRFAAPLSIALLSLALAACGADRDAGAPDPAAEGTASGTGPESFIGRQVAKGIAKAQRELETGNIRLGGHHIEVDGMSFGSDKGADGLPKAEITPEGALLIEGREVDTTAEQRALLLEHRGHIVGLAQAGMEVGAKGADIAGTALTGIGQAVFGGDEGRKAYEARIEAEAERIRQEAVALCERLPALYASQQSLAAALPEFVPYATMTPGDIEDCGKDDRAGTVTAATRGASRT